jgi:hypothetical protein
LNTRRKRRRMTGNPFHKNSINFPGRSVMKFSAVVRVLFAYWNFTPIGTVFHRLVGLIPKK